MFIYLPWFHCPNTVLDNPNHFQKTDMGWIFIIIIIIIIIIILLLLLLLLLLLFFLIIITITVAVAAAAVVIIIIIIISTKKRPLTAFSPRCYSAISSTMTRGYSFSLGNFL